MKNQNRIAIGALAASLLLGAATPTWADSLGVSFNGRGNGNVATAGYPLSASAVAGVVPQALWNNIQDDNASFDGTTNPLLTDTGAFTGVRLTYEANDSWASDGPTVTPNDILMKGTIKANPDPDLAPTNNSDRILFTVTNLPAGTFNVLVYFTQDGTGSEASVDAGGPTTYYLAEQNVFSGTFIRATATAPGAPIANYAQFDAVPSVGGTITITVRKVIVDPQLNTSIAVSAVQIVQISGSTFPPNTQACSINAQPASITNNVVGETATFTVGTTGPARFQWQKNGADILGAVNATYTTPPTVLADNGTTFRAIVYNNVNTNNSLDVILSVGTNTVPSSITAQPVSALVVEGSTATFTVGTAGRALIQWQKNGANISGATNATYTTPATVLADNGSTFHAIVYNNINTNTSADATLTVDPNTPPVATQGFMTVQRWTGVTGTTVEDVIAAEAAGPPNSTFLVTGAAIPDQGIDNYGAKMSGWVKPTVSGNYYFYLASDDQSRLYLNEVAAASGTNALPDPATAAAIAEKFAAGGFELPGAGLGTTPTPIPLAAGKLYGLVAYLKDGTGGDNLRVAWSTNETTPVGQLRPIATPFIYAMATGAGQSSSITTQPKPVTVQSGRPAAFKVAATTLPAGGLYGVQWLKDGAIIPGANSTTYKINSAPTGDNGSMISANIFTLDGVLTSTAVLFTVVPDTFPPVVSAGAITETRATGSAMQLGVTFDEDVNPVDLVASNFTLNSGTGTFSLAQNSLGTYTGVLFTNVTGLAPGGTYTVTVKNIKDVLGHTIATTNVPFTVGQVGWADVGVPPRPSQVIPVGSDGFDILNGGRTEWATYDEVALVFLKKTNDFDVKLQVINAEPSSQWGRVGLQARNALNAGDPPESLSNDTLEIGTNQSAYAQTHVNPNQSLGGTGVWPVSDPIQPGNAGANNGHEQNTRLDTGSATSAWGSPATAPEYPDVWLRLRRVGPVITGFRSEDGETWINQGDVTLTAQSDLMYVGPSLSAETGNIGWTGFNVYTAPYDPVYTRLFLAQFRNFGNVSVPAVPSNLSIAKVGANVVLTWTAGVLQSSPSVATPAFVDVPGATSPYSTPATGGPTFYRLRGTP